MMKLRAVAAAVSMAASACSLAPIDLSSEQQLPLRTTITAADGTFLARLYRQNRALVPLETLPEVLKNAVLAAEDARFYEHPGYDLRSIARAAIIDISKGEVLQGGSTITQQFVKNTYIAHPGGEAPRTLERKAKELRLAIEVERRFSKDEILERYLNTVYLGQGAYGVKAAAETYFGHGAGTLSLTEAALLAGAIKAPSRYDPRDHPRLARQRRSYVLDRMVQLEMITEPEAERAKDSKLGLTLQPPQLQTRQPYFVEAVKREILNDRRFGQTDIERAGALWKGGLRITTTLDRDMQAAAEGAVRAYLPSPDDPEAAIVAIEPDTGEVRAMVGGRDWDLSQVNLALGKAGGGSGRQPGSSFKPIAAAAAMEAGISLDARYDASPGSFHLDDGSTWTVANSEGTSSGFLPLNEALVRSVNGVFARLSLQLGPAAIAKQAELMGVRARLPVYPSIALGSSEVSVLDMATAYATLANYGTAIEPTTIKRIRSAAGAIYEPDQETTAAVIEPGNAFLLTNVLQDVIGRGTGTAARIGRPAAGKTGTTDDHADAWFVGYTPDLVAAVWVGYPQGRIPMTSVHGTRVWGGTYPALIWRAFMRTALAGTRPRAFELPEEDVITVEIDPVTGLLAADWCPGEPKTMLKQLAPREVCPLPSPTDVASPTVVVSPRITPSGTDPSGTPTKTPSPSN
ncbi:MAG: penicillin-binding protein [Actinomycetota bacterium]|jgi:penicillin-binding protein 1A|nr:penicillin-binding protein [Actinomycetota bacterium]